MSLRIASPWPLCLLAVLTLAGGCGSDPSTSSEADQSGPVIAAAKDWNSFAAAQMTGQLVESSGCLMLDDQVVFWTHGASWDAESKSVVLRNGTRVPVDGSFTGNGASYDIGADFADLLNSSSAAKRLTACIERTGATGVVALSA
jgi:hypothetical protein